MEKRKLLAFAPALFLYAASASAQFGGRRSRQGGAERPGGERVSSLEVTLHELHEDLKLGADQEAGWQAYADRVRALGNDVARERSARGAAAQASLLQRIDRAVDVARNRLAAIEDIAQSAKVLYANLSAEQQRTADPRLANIIPIAGSA